MKKHLLILTSLGISILAWGAANVTGTVMTDTSEPVANAVVSDGFSVVTTNASGAYTMPWNDSAQFVFVSVPSGYDFPKDASGTAKIWQAVNKSIGTHIHNFTLHKQEDGGKADSSHVLLVFGDPQVLDSFCIWRFRHETIEDVQQLQASYPAGTKFIGLTVGDVVWDMYDLFPAQKANYERMAFPNFFAIGNHDHKAGTTGTKPGTTVPDTAYIDSVAAQQFETHFGPTYYSFNVGAVHYVVLDNVYYNAQGSGSKGYKCQLTPKQKSWVKKDIEMAPANAQVVYAFHINSTNNNTDRKFLQDLLKTRSATNYIVSGHVHDNSVQVHAANFIEHNVGATEGNFWCCDWCGDGGPNGYKVFETNAKGIDQWYYKATGLSKDFRIKTFPTNSINAGNTKQDKVLANVWDFDKNGKVTILENGVEYNMTRFFSGVDPDAYDMMKDEGDARPNYPSEQSGYATSKNPGCSKSDHMFYYTPKAENSDMIVVYTDRFGKQTSMPVLRHMMVASFEQQGEQWVYQEDFNTLSRFPNYLEKGKVKESRGTWIAGHTPLGWYAATNNKSSVNYSGYNYLMVDNGSLNNGWLYSFGATNTSDPDKNSSERALGSLNTTQQARVCYGVLLENNTKGMITSLDISYVGEVWRMGAAGKQESLRFSYAILSDQEAEKIRDRALWIGAVTTTAVEALNFSTPSTVSTVTNAAIDGNASNNRQEVKGKVELQVLPGQVVMLRWDDDLATDNNTDQALAIDDVQIQATSVEYSALPKVPSSLLNNPSSAHVILYQGEVLIQTDQDTYTLNGQKR